MTSPPLATATGMAWSNWAGLARSRAALTARPTSAQDVVAAVELARDRGERVKMPGSGHSFTDIALTDGLMLDPRGSARQSSPSTARR